MDTPPPESPPPDPSPSEAPPVDGKKAASTSIWLILLGALVLIPGLCFGVAAPLQLNTVSALLALLWVLILIGSVLAAIIAVLGAIFGGKK